MRRPGRELVSWQIGTSRNVKDVHEGDDSDRTTDHVRPGGRLRGRVSEQQYSEDEHMYQRDPTDIRVGRIGYGSAAKCRGYVVKTCWQFGGGKSLLFFLPAWLEATAAVIVPSIMVMQDVWSR